MFVETMYNDVDITILLYPEIKGKTNKTRRKSNNNTKSKKGLLENGDNFIKGTE